MTPYKTYKVALGCNNCGRLWAESFPFGCDVKDARDSLLARNRVFCGKSVLGCGKCGSLNIYKVTLPTLIADIMRNDKQYSKGGREE